MMCLCHTPCKDRASARDSSVTAGGDDLLVSYRGRPSAMATIVITEVEEGWARNKRAHDERRAQIERARALRPGGTSGQQELADLKKQEDEHRIEPLMSAVWDRLGMSGKPPRAGVFPSQQARGKGDLEESELRAAAVYHGLRESGRTDPSDPGFDKELNRCRDRFDRDKDRYVAIARKLAADEPRLSWRKVEATRQHMIDNAVAGHDDAAIADAAAYGDKDADACVRSPFVIADMTGDGRIEIVEDHLRAAAVIYTYEALDDAGLFAAVDEIIEMADNGRVVLSCEEERAIEAYRYDPVPVAERYDAVVARMFPSYAREQFAAVVKAAYEFTARLTQDDLLSAGIPASISEQPLRTTAKALAIHLSEQGWGTTYSTAEAVMHRTVEAHQLVREDSVGRACGVAGELQVVASVTGSDIGEVTREYARAEAGATVLSWLATKAEALSAAHWDTLLDIHNIAAGTGSNDANEPTDADFLAACAELHGLLGLEERIDVDDEGEEIDAAGEDEEVDEGGGVGNGFGTLRGVRTGRPSEGVLRLKPSNFPGGLSQTGA
jgi:hypothetical protein